MSWSNKLKLLILILLKNIKNEKEKILNLKNTFRIKNNKNIYSFLAIYRTINKNEKVNLINKLYIQIIDSIIIENHLYNRIYEYYFSQPGDHQVKIILNEEKFKTFEFMFYQINHLISFNFITQNFDNNLMSMKGMFKNCINLEYVTFIKNSFQKINDFSHIFENCISLTFVDFSNIITNYAKNISYMFANCFSLKYINLSKFHTFNVKDMSGLFFHCSSLTSINLSSFKTSNLINMKYMFTGCSNLTSININFFETKNIKDINNMFENCTNLKILKLPDNITERITNKKEFFKGCYNLFKKNYDICMLGSWFATNYGSLATNYALHQTVKNMGYSILMIDSPIKRKSKITYGKCEPITIGKSLYNISQKKPFNQLYEFNDICQSFLVGSDVLWKPYVSRPYKQFFFLDFVNNDKKKISYATSFGGPYNGNDDEKSITKQNLQRFDLISVRDKLSLNITKNIFDIKNVIQVCDPTFICNYSEYEKLINKSKVMQKNEYILAYILDPTKEIGYRLEKLSVDKNITVIILLKERQKVWKKEKKKLNLKGNGKIIVKDMVDLNDFMWYYNHSKAIFTDSFHGTVFSIIFRKPFITLRNVKRGGERFSSLLIPINLDYRLFETPDCINERYDLYDSINYDIPYQKLNQIKNFSYNWLRNALK